jgi:hypothetical protein
VTHTPTVFANGQRFVETFTAAEVAEAIRAALAARDMKSS